MKITTRKAVVIGLLVAQAASLLALFFVSGRIAADAESDHQNALLNTESAEAVDRMRAHIQPAESIVQLSSSLLADPSIEAESLRDSFREAMELSPQLDGVFVGGADGSFMYVSRDGDGYREKTIELVDGVRDTTLVYLGADGVELSRELDPADTYDPTARPWYQAASTGGEVIWTDPYVFFTSQQLGITTASPIVVDGEITGVIGADLELGSLSRFLTSIDSGTDGRSIIVNHDGVVIAHPDPELIQRPVDDGLETVAIADLDDTQARAAVASYVLQGAESDEVQLTSYRVDGVESRGSFRNVNVGEGVWTVAVFGPEDSLVGNLASARATERTLLVMASLLGLVLVLLIGTRATRPLDELENHAWSDSLTGLPNRRSILRSVDRDLTANDGWSSVAMVDIDKFKLVNDTYGHQVGDEVLAEVARRAEDSLPEGATIGRIGGEEFLIVMPDAGISDAWQICEEVRRAVRADPVQHSSGALEVTVSLGLATAQGPAARDHMISVADVALLEAKSTGRDKVVSGSGPRSVNIETG